MNNMLPITPQENIRQHIKPVEKLEQNKKYY